MPVLEDIKEPVKVSQTPQTGGLPKTPLSSTSTAFEYDIASPPRSATISQASDESGSSQPFSTRSDGSHKSGEEASISPVQSVSGDSEQGSARSVVDALSSPRPHRVKKPKERDRLRSSRPDPADELDTSTASESSGQSASSSPVSSAAFDSTSTPRLRTQSEQIVRLLSLYIVPVVLALPISLLLHLTTHLLTPLYNSIPLTLHTPHLYAFYALIISLVYWNSTKNGSARQCISARVCVCIAALGGELVVVSGRGLGSYMGRRLGPRYGALISRGILGLGSVGGATGFALLCLDHISQVAPAQDTPGQIGNLVNILFRAVAYVIHVYYGEKLWEYVLEGNTSMIIARPEKSILFISLLLTALSLFLRSPPITHPSFPVRLHQTLTQTFKLKSKASKSLSRLTSGLPSTTFPLLLLIRLPLLILALRQQIFLRPTPPYTTANGQIRVLSSEKGITGQVVVAENLRDGYRFLRCDASLLGGKWMRNAQDGGKSSTILGDSIFATFPLQEIGILAHRSDTTDSLARTISLTTELQLVPEGEDDDLDGDEEKPEERALVIGLGIGIAAGSFSKRGLAVDVVEIDPLVYDAAIDHFNLTLSGSSTVNILSGSTYVNTLATSEYNMTKWSYVVHDCFSGGSVPGELYTLEFWEELVSMLEYDGIVAINFAGLLGSSASKAVLQTLFSVFTQCRAFGDGLEKGRGKDELTNMVVLCTMTYSPLLSFRPPTSLDVQRSPLRSHVYSTFLQNEMQLDEILPETDTEDDGLVLRRGEAGLDQWQVESSLATWRAMQQLLTPAMWLAW